MFLCFSWIIGNYITVTPTPSLPPGFYRNLERGEHFPVGTIVKFTPPDAVVPTMPAGIHYVMKKVAAVPGDGVCWSADVMVINNSERIPRHPDHGLTAGLEGCQVLQANELIVVGTHPKSVDSRDWGPLDQRRITHRLKPLWTWSQGIEEER
jgi:type IV secretory pathway protease TraF